MCRSCLGWFVFVFGSLARLLFALCINLSCAAEWKLAKFMRAETREKREELHFCHVHTKQSMWFGFKFQLHFIVAEVEAVERGGSVLKLMWLSGNLSSTLKWVLPGSSGCVHKNNPLTPPRPAGKCDTLTGIAFPTFIALSTFTSITTFITSTTGYRFWCCKGIWF